MQRDCYAQLLSAAQEIDGYRDVVRILQREISTLLTLNDNQEQEIDCLRCDLAFTQRRNGGTDATPPQDGRP